MMGEVDEGSKQENAYASFIPPTTQFDPLAKPHPSTVFIIQWSTLYSTDLLCTYYLGAFPLPHPERSVGQSGGASGEFLQENL